MKGHNNKLHLLFIILTLVVSVAKTYNIGHFSLKSKKVGLLPNWTFINGGIVPITNLINYSEDETNYMLWSDKSTRTFKYTNFTGNPKISSANIKEVVWAIAGFSKDSIKTDMNQIAIGNNGVLGLSGAFTVNTVTPFNELQFNPFYGTDFNITSSIGCNARTGKTNLIVPYSDGVNDYFLMINDNNNFCGGLAVDGANTDPPQWNVALSTSSLIGLKVISSKINATNNDYAFVLIKDANISLAYIGLTNGDTTFTTKANPNNDGQKAVHFVTYKNAADTILFVAFTKSIYSYSLSTGFLPIRTSFINNCSPYYLMLATNANFEDTLIMACTNTTLYEYNIQTGVWTLLHQEAKNDVLIKNGTFNWLKEADGNNVPVLLFTDSSSLIHIYNIRDESYDLLASISNLGEQVISTELMIMDCNIYGQTFYENYLMVGTIAGSVWNLNGPQYRFLVPTPSESSYFYERKIFSEKLHSFFPNSTLNWSDEQRIEYFAKITSNSQVLASNIPSFWRLQNEINNNYVILANFTTTDTTLGLPPIILDIVGYRASSNSNTAYYFELIYYVIADNNRENIGFTVVTGYDELVKPITFANISYTWTSTVFNHF
ncbi:MAG: hypothetical protein EOP34_06285 [Rickettsiales bacterium]|nr:MAG: hypothetical protein EOP34_06285 [Rickettsiales bacterium]